MTQPHLRFQRTHNPPYEDNAPIDAGVSFQPLALQLDVTITQVGNWDFLVLSEPVFIDHVFARIVTPLSAGGTFEVGLSTNADELIDTADWNEEVANAFAQNRGSANATSPNGVLLPAGTILRVTNTGTAGRVQVVLIGWQLGTMLAMGSQFVHTI